jgi:hypothetical protein
MEPEEGAKGVVQVVFGLTERDSGKFLSVHANAMYESHDSLTELFILGKSDDQRSSISFGSSSLGSTSCGNSQSQSSQVNGTYACQSKHLNPDSDSFINKYDPAVQ